MKGKRAVAVIVREGRFLVIHRVKNSSEYYVFPGGSVEEGESFEEALEREVKEELGYTIDSHRFLFEVDNQGRTEHWYKIEPVEKTEPILGGPEKDRNSQENLYAFKWLSADDLFSGTNIHPHEAINKLKNQHVTKIILG